MKRTNGFQLERALAGGQTLPPWAAALCGGLCAAGALTLLAGSFPVLPAWAALLLGLLLGAGLALLPQRAWLTPALCGAAALFCLCAFVPVTAGLRQLADCVRRWLTARTGYIYLTSSGGMRQGLWAFLPLGFLSALASGRCARRGSVWFAAVSLPLAAVGCAIGLFPSCWGLLLLACGLTALLLFRTDRGRTAALLLAGCLLLSAPLGLLSLPESGTGAALASGLHALRYDAAANSMPEGKLHDLSAWEKNGTPALRVTMEQPQRLYLRGFVGEVYTGRSWQPLDPQTLADEAGRFYWLHEKGYYAQSAVGTAAVLAGQTQVQTVTVTNLSACGAQAYLPTGLADSALLEADCIGDRVAKAPGKTYSCSCAVGGLRDWYAAQQALADDPDGAAQWLTLDEGYRAFAEAQFLELTPEAAGAAQALLGSEMQGKTLPEILQAIRQTLTEHFVYDESVSTQNGTQDFFQYVQSVTARGYSVHYATAAVLMLRYCGVPARYAEGYYLSGQDAASGEQTFELDETHAHAWAEYYLTGVGWVPFEVTPGYVEAEDLGAGGEAGGKQYENTQLPPVVEQPEQQAPQEETQRSFHWWLAAIPLAAALLALVLCQLWRRRRLHRRIAAMAADEPREAVTQLYGYAVFLLARTGAAPPAGLEQARQDNAEAMFSGHAIPAEKAAAMQHFVQETLQACRAERNLFQRFADRWFHIWY